MQETLVILSLGSNIEPRDHYIAQAVEALKKVPDLHRLRVSRFYETEPVDVPDEDRSRLFLNAVAVFETALTPACVLAIALEIETSLGRKRTGRYGEARTIDIDIVSFGDQRIQTPSLTLPHPRAHERVFVLKPLAEILPDYRLPGQEKTIIDLLQERS